MFLYVYSCVLYFWSFWMHFSGGCWLVVLVIFYHFCIFGRFFYPAYAAIFSESGEHTQKHMFFELSPGHFGGICWGVGVGRVLSSLSSHCFSGRAWVAVGYVFLLEGLWLFG